MVDVKEIQERLKKLKSNKEILVYLGSLLDEVKDKKLLKEIKLMIENVKELDAVAQIETKGRVDWSLPKEEEVFEDRSLEKQVVDAPIIGEETKEKDQVKYSLGSNVDLYREGTRGPDIKYTGSNVVSEVGGKSFIDGRVNEQYMGKDLDKSHEDIMGEGGLVKYHALEGESIEYASASVSQEVHERAKKKPIH